MVLERVRNGLAIISDDNGVKSPCQLYVQVRIGSLTSKNDGNPLNGVTFHVWSDISWHTWSGRPPRQQLNLFLAHREVVNLSIATSQVEPRKAIRAKQG